MKNQFLKLIDTEARPVYVNFAHVNFFQLMEDGKVTELSLLNENPIEVVNSPEEILALLNPPFATAQVNAAVERLFEPFRPYGPGQKAFEDYQQAQARRDPIVLSIVPSSQPKECSCTKNIEFCFKINGQSYLYGPLQECVQSRDAYAADCIQRNIPYTITDLPEPYKSDLEDFHANPVIGGGLKAAEAVPGAETGDSFKLASAVDPDWTQVASEWHTVAGRRVVKSYKPLYQGKEGCLHLMTEEVKKGGWVSVVS